MNMMTLSKTATTFAVAFASILVVLALLLFPSALLADDYTPIDACRLLDTRVTHASPLAPGTTLSLRARMMSDSLGNLHAPGQPQGGDEFCGVPMNSTAVFITIIAVNPSANGHVTVWRYGTFPGPSSMNVSAGKTESTGLLSYINNGNSAFDLNIVGSGIASHYVVDLHGYASPSTNTLVGQAVGILNGHTLVIETLRGTTYQVYAPTTHPTYRTSWIASLPLAVGSCVHVDGFWRDGNNTSEQKLFEARSLPIVQQGYCGAENELPVFIAAPFPVRELRHRAFIGFINSEPLTLAPGDTFIVIGGTGLLTGHDRDWAVWNGSDWAFEQPLEGDLGMSLSDGSMYRYKQSGGEEWRALTMAASGI